MANPISIAEIGALIGDVARANILSALMGGKALTATELSWHARVSAQTTSGHLAKLLDGKLVAVEKQGRHRYYRLASQNVVDALEQLTTLASLGPKRHRPTGPKDVAMRRARTCYDHLAGRIAVAIADRLTSAGYIQIDDGAGLVTDEGRRFFCDFGIDLDPRPGSHRPLCRCCLDWSERRMHLGGRLGAAILKRTKDLNWLRAGSSSRALDLTPAGERGLRDVFDIAQSDLAIDAA
ncbi:ArsR/SmtB family transcription factor [Rhizobium halophytocola]|uniref:DNA-binding transcriptional ArsR family regulator n=1 Tax=Rhizobium halophytocola TaxID=735519 RepID=A0ABS4DZ99_9HYPH|nr:helix-turn-helix transcriptional regulator [Rhizobium halophytocola]MBP1851016.1 DNA-binding transcriptional ArsR family regulator [Rhizobium halophytocola]